MGKDLSDAVTVTQDRFVSLLQRLGCEHGHDKYHWLHQQYSEKHRYYHNLNHIEDCLAQFDHHRDLAEKADELEFAIWAHDVVYKTRAQDNEAQSAQWAVETLSQGSTSAQTKQHIEQMIMATCHTAQPQGQDQRLLVDIDLSILGRNQQAFQQYDEAIRKEYQWVPNFIYLKKRAEVLQGFLLKPKIYHTKILVDLYEQRARENINNWLEGHGN